MDEFTFDQMIGSETFTGFHIFDHEIRESIDVT